MSAPLTEYTTFHKLLDYLQYYQEQSPMLNTFGYGNLVDFGKNISGNSVNYPFLFVVPQAIEYQDNMTVYSVSMIFADILNWDLSNEKDCVSDMSLEARRFLSYIKRGINTMPEIYDNIDVELPINALPFFERFGDHVAGVALEVPLIVYDTIDACDYYPSPTPSPIPPTPTITPSITPTITPSQTCPITTQYLEVELFDNTKFKLILWNDAGFTSPANALCDYQISGTAYGSLGTVYSGVETIDSGQHQHQFNLSPILQPGEVVTGFTVYSYSATTCVCPVNLILPAQPTPTPTQTQTNTPTVTQTPTMTPTPSSSPTPISGTCWCYEVVTGNGQITYTDCFGNPQTISTPTVGQQFNAIQGTASASGFATIEDCASNYIDPYLNALENVGYTATTQEVNGLTIFIETLIDTQYINSLAGQNDFIGMYPMLGGTAASTAINLMNPGTYDLSYSGTPSYDLSGVTFGSGDYAVIGTGLTQSQIGTSGNTHTALYCADGNGQNTAFGSRQLFPFDSRYFMRIPSGGGNFNYAINDATVYGGAGATGDTGGMIISRVGSDIFYSKTEVNLNPTGAPVQPSNLTFGVGASFTDANTIFEYMDGKMSYFSWGKGIFGVGGNSNYVSYINQLQTNLGRKAH